MPRIPDTDMTIFSSIEKTVFDRFTEHELGIIHRVARILKQILDTSIKREYPSQR
jgi:hypothetical protein